MTRKTSEYTISYPGITNVDLAGEQFLSSTVEEVYIALYLNRYCGMACDFGNGGIIKGCREWKPQQWRGTLLMPEQIKTIMAGDTLMWSWNGNDLHVLSYRQDIADGYQKRVESGKEFGKLGGRPKGSGIGNSPDPTDAKPKSLKTKEKNPKGTPKGTPKVNQVEGEGEEQAEGEVLSSFPTHPDEQACADAPPVAGSREERYGSLEERKWWDLDDSLEKQQEKADRAGNDAVWGVVSSKFWCREKDGVPVKMEFTTLSLQYIHSDLKAPIQCTPADLGDALDQYAKAVAKERVPMPMRDSVYADAVHWCLANGLKGELSEEEVEHRPRPEKVEAEPVKPVKPVGAEMSTKERYEASWEEDRKKREKQQAAEGQD